MYDSNSSGAMVEAKSKMPFDKKKCDKRFNSLKEEANTWVTTWKELRDLIAPDRGFFEQVPNQGQSYDHKLLVDSTQVKDNGTLASGLMTGLTSPNRPWFKLLFTNPALMEDQEVRAWLEESTSRINQVFQESNIYGTLYNVYEELGCFGTGSMAIMEDFEKVIRGRNYTCGEFYIGHDANGDINAFGREYWLTVDQVVEEFGLENCSETVKQQYKDGECDKWIQIRHLIEVNKYRIMGKRNNTQMPFVSYYWEVSASGSEKFLSISGFEEFPVMAPRWSVPTQMTTYGRGPGWSALGDIKMLQKMQKDKLMGLSKIVNPPVQVDASVMGEPNLLAGGVTRFSATLPNAGVKAAYQVPIDLEAVEATIEKTRDSVGQFFHRQTFLSITSRVDGPQMTAREVTELHDEKLLTVGSVLNKLEKELLTPMIIRTFNIMMRRLLLPPPPEVVGSQKYDIEYTSMLFQAQRMAQIGPNQALVGYAMNASSAFPEVLDVIDAEEAIREYALLSGASAKLTRTKEQVAMIQEQKAQAAAEQKQMNDISGAVQGAKVLSETSLDNNNALRALIQ